MSVPIPNASLILGATRIAGEVASRVGSAMGFDQILQREVDQHEPLEDGPQKLTALQDQLVQSIHARLSQAGIEVNQPIELRVLEHGWIRVAGSHPQAAEIESLLNSDSQLTEQARSLGESKGAGEFPLKLTIPDRPVIPIDLTIGDDPGNILQSSGGYPNW